MVTNKIAILYMLSYWCMFDSIHCQLGGKMDCQVLLFKKTEITSVLFTGDITNFTVDNVQECANRCPDFTGCRSFGFDMTSSPQVCYLYKNHITWGQPGLDYSSVYYYWQVERKCPVDQGYIWNTTLSVCYKIFPISYGKKTWSEAQSKCEETNGNLYIPDTNDKVLMLEEVINNEYNDSTVDEFIFVGANDFHRDLSYYWLNGDNITNWQKYQPDHFEGKEHCAGLRNQNSNLGLIDTNCNVRRSFVCEIQVIE